MLRLPLWLLHPAILLCRWPHDLDEVIVADIRREWVSALVWVVEENCFLDLVLCWLPAIAAFALTASTHEWHRLSLL